MSTTEQALRTPAEELRAAAEKLREAALEAEAVHAEEVTLGPDETYAMALIDHQRTVRTDLTQALVVARAINDGKLFGADRDDEMDRLHEEGKKVAARLEQAERLCARSPFCGRDA